MNIKAVVTYGREDNSIRGAERTQPTVIDDVKHKHKTSVRKNKTKQRLIFVERCDDLFA